MKPAHDDQGGDTANDAAHLGKTNQLVVGWRWHRGHGRTIKPIVARTGKFVYVDTRVHTPHRSPTPTWLASLNYSDVER